MHNRLQNAPKTPPPRQERVKLLIRYILLKEGHLANQLAATARRDETNRIVTNSEDQYQYHSCGRHLIKYVVACFVRTSEAILNSPSKSIPEIAPLEAVLTTEHVMDHHLCRLK